MRTGAQIKLDSDKNCCKVILSQPMTRVDDGKAGFTISKLNDLLAKWS